MLQLNGIDKSVISPITKTIISYIDKDTYSYDSYPSGEKIGSGEGIIIRINDDNSCVILWGQKMRFTPNRVTMIGSKSKPFYIRCGSTGVYKSSSNIKVGKWKNEQENKYSEVYWKEYEEDYFKGLEGDYSEAESFQFNYTNKIRL